MMTPLERTALTAAFMAAVVAAGLTLSLVVHVELVTLVVFASGIALGAWRGALVGALGMTLYVFANSAIRGFPPSPLPLLAAQATGMAIAGILGGWWRRIWLRSGRPGRRAFLLLPVLGALSSGVFQVLTNIVYALFMSPEAASRMGVFLSGLSFGALDVLSNAIIFALAGPGVASVLRRLSRERGWWARTSMIVVLASLGQAPAFAGSAPGRVLASQDSASVIADSVAAPLDTTRAAPIRMPVTQKPAATRPSSLRRLHLYPGPMWTPMSPRQVVERGGIAFVTLDSLAGMDPSRVASPGVAPSLDPWGLGWGRVRWSYDGLPLRGGVHGFDEPPDLPLAWRGAWVQRQTATGAEFAVDPFPGEGPPQSQITITTGGYDRRTTEFGLFRLFGSVALGADFMDRIEQGRPDLGFAGQSDVDELDHTRFWLRLARAPGRRPDWSVDVSTGGDDRTFFDGGTLKRGARRIQASLRGPFWGGATRLGAQLRRQSLRLEGGPTPFGEVLFDGYTIQADWAGPFLRGLSTRVSWDHDRRRGLFEDASFDGVMGRAAWSHRAGKFSAGLEGTLGHQEPYGNTWGGLVSGSWEEAWVTLRASVSREEDLPSLVVGVDRPAPEEGLEETLRARESASDPEERAAVLLESELRGGAGSLLLRGWVARQRHYRLDSNPLWNFVSLYAPLPYPSSSADFAGMSARLDLRLPAGFRGEGRARLHSRDETQVPYQARWSTDGALHWRGWVFNRSLDLDLALGGLVLGTRRTPEGDTYPAAGTAFVRLEGRVDNGVFTAAMENVLDAYLESDLRGTDLITPFPVAGRTFYVGLTFYLSQ